MWKLALIGVCAAVILIARQVTGLLGAIIAAVAVLYLTRTTVATQGSDATAAVEPLAVLWIVAIGGVAVLFVKDWIGL